ncbi:MAG: DUF4402 domain-containing protein [Alphaproteobacteria bacterium]|nr:DUF4402 domain-containing protein [Alphaproteobacteria bacterium]
MQGIRNVMRTRKYCLFVLALVLAGFAYSRAMADSININEIQTLTFPTLGLPSGGGSVNLSISPLNSSTSGTAQILRGSASRGQYALSLVQDGSPISISIDISGVNSGGAGLTLDNFRGFYNSQTIDSFPSSTLALPAVSPASTPLYIGARITANSTVTPGAYNGGFTITVFIQ